ncbi:hypothetical protein [Lusitaniella coriacea]|uniref:hypothetical protein n=1 Tax=Lusitaniella coriacea TaxID=1983105 RepID=UPI003CE6F486
MPVETITLNIPEPLYQRLLNTARAASVPLEDIVLRALQIGSPPTYEDIPEEFQADIAALDRLDDNTLWQLAKSQKTEADLQRYTRLLDRNQDRVLTESEKLELMELRRETDLFMLRKAHAAALLRWRGHSGLTP